MAFDFGASLATTVQVTEITVESRPSDPRATAIVSKALSNDTLATLLDQSLDCIKLIGMDGTVQYMNGNGLCAMEIDDAAMILGRDWESLWPSEARPRIVEALEGQDGRGRSLRRLLPDCKGQPALVGRRGFDGP